VWQGLQAGHAERLKWTTHAALGLLAGVCLVYNVTAWWVRRERHLARNVAIYSAMVALEIQQCQRHREAVK
jgi:hypothetical protein